MVRKPRIDKFWNYVAECAQIFYWSYFKPFTFANWLRDIHPELTPYSNPFAMQAEFSTNPRLSRYAGQVWWLTVIVPLLAVLLVAPIYSLAANEAFNGFRSCLFFLGWLIGLLLARGNNVRLEKWFYRFLYISSGAILLFNLSFRLAPETMRSFLQALPATVQLLPTVTQLWPMALGVAVGVAFGVAVGVAFGMAFGVAVGVAVGVAGGVAFGVAGGVAFGVAFGVAVGVAGGVAFGVAFGVALSLGVLRVYFWLPELLWILILFLFSRQGYGALTLCYLPPRFDELIILPLPFMTQLIVEAYQENPAAARQTIDYLITSTNQQKTAGKAIAGIAVDGLNQCQTTRDIVAITDQLSWIPSPPPKELGSVLPQFLEISQSVCASQEGTSAYRQKELLTSPILALHQLKNSLAFGQNAQLATTFGSITQRWLTILETAQRTLEEQASRSAEIPQVYIAGPALDPERSENRFKGRIDLFREIETLALSSQPPVLLLYGGRRTGKTSTLKYLPQKVGSDLVPLLVDLQGAASATTLRGLAEYLATEIIKAARQSRNLRLPQLDADKLAQDPFLALQNWFNQIEDTASSKRFLLCLDEFERLSEVVEVTKSRAPLNFLRHIMQHRHQWILLFSGSHTRDELDSYWSDYLINTRTLKVSYLDAPAVRELIIQPVTEFPNIYELSAVDTIIQLTRCQPYLVQLMCYELVEQLNRQAGKNALTTQATSHDVQTIIPKALETGGEYFRELWKNLTSAEQDLLLRLVNGETSAEGEKAVLRRLEGKELLEKTGEGYSFQVPLIQKFVEGMAMEEV